MLNGMNFINKKEVNTISELNLLHDILNPSKSTKDINTHYSPILHVCIDTRKGKAKFKDFRILLHIECSSTIVMRMIIEKLTPKKDDVMEWNTQAGNITTNLKVKIYLSTSMTS